MKVAAILLAAGQSTRMGFHKGFLPWHGKTLFEHQLQVLEASKLSDIIVVTGFESEPFLKIAKDYTVTAVTNTNYLNGKCSSILAGLQIVSKETEAIVIVAVDQPTEASIIHQLIEALHTNNSLIAVPVYCEKRGHPVLFSTKIMKDLLSISEDTKGLRAVFQKYPNSVIEVPINHSLIKLNINTLKDYQKARNMN